MGTAAIVVVLVLLCLGAIVLLSDRTLAAAAERTAAGYLVVPLGAGATVRVHGAAFLQQALRGRYERIEVSGNDMRLGELRHVALHAYLRNARLPLAAVIGRRVRELPCEHVTGSIVIPWPELARVVPVPGLALSLRGGRLVASASLPIPGISQLGRVSGEARLSVDDGQVWLRVRGLSVAGIAVPAVLLTQLVPSLTVPIPLPPLPYGLRLEALDPHPDGLVASGSANAVVLRRPSPAP